MLTHIREKLRFYEKGNKVSQSALTQLEGEILQLRNGVSHCKKDRDSIRDDNKELKIKQGFASNELLISDFEKRKRTILFTYDRISDLQARHHALSLQVALPSPKIQSTSTVRGSGTFLHIFSLFSVYFLYFFCVFTVLYLIFLFFVFTIFFLLFFVSLSYFYLLSYIRQSRFLSSEIPFAFINFFLSFPVFSRFFIIFYLSFFN